LSRKYRILIHTDAGETVSNGQTAPSYFNMKDFNTIEIIEQITPNFNSQPRNSRNNSPQEAAL